MEDKDWWRVSMKEDPHVVEWSPVGEKNVRIQDAKGNWVYTQASRADEAYPRACQALQEDDA